MSPSPLARVDAGVPSGGQFTARRRTEPTVSLGGPVIPAGQLRALTNLDPMMPTIDLTDDQLVELQGAVAASGDFTSRAVRRGAEELYRNEHVYSPDEYAEYVRTVGDSSAYSGDPKAVRRDIEQMRKDALRGRTS
ncbi:hypothetical protein [Arthrobacter sp. N1]|uniref:hypothetical protein n=1 Tax=Arthrobacter sp. N1 TaxID=619291 RepID=UPI003BB0A21F